MKQKMSLEKMKGILSQTLSRDELKAVMAGSGGSGGGGTGGGTCSDFCIWNGSQMNCNKNASGWCVCPVDPWIPCQR